MWIVLILAAVTGMAIGAPSSQPPESGLSLPQALADRFVRGVASIRIQDKTFLGVWERPEPDRESFEVLEEREGLYYSALRFANEGSDWQSVSTLEDGRLPGFVLRSEGADYWYGQTTIVAFVKGRFEVVYRGLDTTEIVDLNNDGYPELFASGWPDADGGPESTTVYVWSGQTFEKLMVVRFKQRFGPRVVAAVRAYRRRVPPS